MRVQASTKRQDYINKLFGNETELINSVRKKLAEDDKLGINISASEARILQMLIAANRVEKVVEIGCLYGYSALFIADALPEAGMIHTLELSEENASIANSFFEKSDNKEKINLIVGDANESLKQLSKSGPFDMVFIDANKGGYINYLNWAIENVKPGGLIIGDNTFLFGHVYGEGKTNVGSNPVNTMLQFNEVLSDQNMFYSCILPTSEGMTVAVKK